MYDKIKLRWPIDGAYIGRMMKKHDATPVFVKDEMVGCKYREGAMSVECFRGSASLIVSLPKVLYPSNVEVMRRDEIDDALGIIESTIEQKREFLRVSEIEVFNTWDMTRPPIEYICRMGDAGRYMPREQSGTTLYFGRLNKDAKKVLCFYDKGAESEKEGILMSGNILRYEMRLKKRLSKYGITTADTMTESRVIKCMEQLYKGEYMAINKLSTNDMKPNKDGLLAFLMASNPEDVETYLQTLRARPDVTAGQRYRLCKAIESLTNEERDDVVKELDDAVNGTRWE